MSPQTRIKTLGICLVVVGVLGLIGLGFQVIGVLFGGNEDFQREFLRDLPGNLDPEVIQRFQKATDVAALFLNLLISPFTIFAGVQLMRQRGRMLGIVASVLALMPLPCWGCCCIGPFVVVFGLIVLFGAEVRQLLDGTQPVQSA